jgi:hypothetical protein
VNGAHRTVYGDDVQGVSLGGLTVAETVTVGELAEKYSRQLRGGVESVFDGAVGQPGGKYFEMASRLEANVTKFGVYKAARCAAELEKVRNNDNLLPFEKKRNQQFIISKYKRWGVMEHAAAVKRANVARQWAAFKEGKNEKYYPNIIWLPSRAAVPMPEHQVFWNRIWSKEDEFWAKHCPGDHFGCACSWAETGAPVNATWKFKDLKGNDVTMPEADKGLEGNPGKTGEVFSGEASHFKNVGSGSSVAETIWSPIEKAVEEYIKYGENADYTEVKINWIYGGVTATNKGHVFDPVRGSYERDVRDLVYNTGDYIILENEKTEEKSCDGKWNGSPYEQRACENGKNPNNIKNGLEHAASKPGVKIAVLYFPNNDFTETKFKEGLQRYEYYNRDLGQGKYVAFEEIIIINNGKIMKKTGI